MSEPIHLSGGDIDAIIDALAQRVETHLQTALACSPGRGRVDWAISQRAYMAAHKCSALAEQLDALRYDGGVVHIEGVRS